MKTRFLVALVCAVASFGFSSCDDDEWSFGSAPFLGSWYGVNNDSSFTFYSRGDGWYTDPTGMTTSFTWDYNSEELDVYLDDAYGSIWSFAWSFTPEGYLALYDYDYGGTTYYSR